jgi:hypothetical protein
MRSRSCCVVLLATAFTAAALAKGPDVSDMRAYALPGYTIVTHDEESARKMTPAVDALQQVMTNLLEKQASHSPLPTHAFVVPLNVWRRYLQPKDYVFSEYFAARFRTYILIANSGEQNAVRVSTLHEFAHHFLRSQREGVIPTWYDEGIASFMGQLELRGENVVAGRVSPLRETPWFPLDELLALNMSTPNYWGLKYTDRVLLESWALVHRGLVGNLEFGKQTQAYLQDVADGVSIDEAVTRNFGTSVKDLNLKMQSYLHVPPGNIRTVPFNRMPRPDSLPGRDMPGTEVLELLAQVMLDAALKPERVGEVISAIEERAPGSPAAAVLRLRLALLESSPTRISSAWQIVKDAAKDPKVGRDAALAVHDRVSMSNPSDPARAAEQLEMRDRAFAWLDASLKANPQDPEAAWAYGMLAAQLKRDLDEAMNRVKAAREVLPEHSDLAMAAALLHSARGESNSMMLRLRDVARFTRSPEERSWARSHLK